MARTPYSSNDDEIDNSERIPNDFGKYIEPFLRQWQWIVVCALGMGILAYLFLFISNYLQPRSYTAVVLVASTQTESSANFGSEITSASEVQLAQVAGGIFYDRTLRLQSFVAMVQNGTVAEQVMGELGPTLKNIEGTTFTASDLQDMVSGDLLPRTDTIRITVNYNDPVIAAEIANAWGKAYVKQINETYSSSGTTFKATEAEVAQAKTDYDNAEAALEDFISHDRTAEYNRKIGEFTKIVVSLAGARSSVGEQQVQDHMAQLSQAWNDSRQIGLFISNAVSMRSAVSGGGEPAAISNALALTMLKTQIYAAYPGTNTLQVQNLPEALGSNISTVNASGMVADLDALISTLETRHTELTKLIDTLSSQVQNEDYLMNFSTDNTPIETKILEDEQKIRELNSLVAAQTSTLAELTQNRDLAWKSYSALATKATELSVNAQNSQVVLASSATVSSTEKAGLLSTLSSIPWALLLGLLIGIFIAYAYEFWQNYKMRQPERIVKKISAYVKKLFYRRPITSRKA